MNTNTKQKPVKILCAGEVNGKFAQLSARIKTINQKCGPFDALFCVGEFFGADEEQNKSVLDGELQFPLPTYILGPCCPSTAVNFPAESSELSQSLTFLGRKGILTTANGLSVAYFSGIEAKSDNDQHQQQGETKAFEFNQKSVDDLLSPISANSGFLGVDLLLTSVWPTDVWTHSTNQPASQPEGSKLVARLAAGLRPRYHFAGRGIHYERSPYRNHRILIETTQHVTRFIGLSSMDNVKKEKWLYAFSITPMRNLPRGELVAQPENCSEFPYMAILQDYHRQKVEESERRRAEEGGAVQFFYDMQAAAVEDDDQSADSGGGGGRKRRRDGRATDGQRRPRLDPNACWFCLSNANTEKHLIVSVASHTYAAMPKGPLTERHLLVMSIGHVQSLVAASVEVREEIFKYRDAYSLFCDRNGEVLCIFERNYKTEHLQVQFVPIPKTKGKALRSTFLNLARLKNIEFTFLKDDDNVWDLVKEGSPYFYAEFPDGTRMLSRSMAQFPLQFGREVFTNKALLDCEEKVDWRNCSLKKEEETQLAANLKQQFKPFAFANENSDEDD
uniref:CwfJ_C_1 domain-containing protein n=1 Tax=Globodera pallida TaxID=36090 RepID=A0A183BJU8_GLOPA